MKEPVIKRDRRGFAGPPSKEVEERRRYCWQIQSCSPEQRENCYAYFSKQNCWDLWALRPLGRKRCCLKYADCRQCPIASGKFGASLVVHPPSRPLTRRGPAGVRTVVCPHLAVQGQAAAPAEIERVLAAAANDDTVVMRCRLRGAHLDPTYVGDVCATASYLSCVFVE